MRKTHSSQYAGSVGGAKIVLISKGDQKLTFKDIEGSDQFKLRDKGARAVPEEPQALQRPGHMLASRRAPGRCQGDW